jgi:hypothetical protein
MRYLTLLGLCVVIFSCNSTPKQINRTDTVIVAYNQNGQYIFNKAIVWTHMGRKFKSDSGLEAEIGVIQQFALRLPTVKSDSVVDTVTHKLIRINDQYPIVFLPDSLSHYLHIIDTLHTK